MDKKSQIGIVTLIIVLLVGAGIVIANEKTNSKDNSLKNPVQENAKNYFTIKAPDTYLPTAVYVPYIAEELGYFEEEGIKIQWTGAIPPGQHVAAVVAGSNDFGTLHINRQINGMAAGAKITAVVAGSETTKERPHMTYLVLDNSSIKGANDLIGKKIGLAAYGGCNEYTPYEYLKKNGIQNPKGKFEIVIVPSGKEELVLRQKEVDIIGVHGYPLQILKHGGVRILFDDYDVWDTVGGATPIYFRNDFIKEHPDVVRGFVRAIAKANDWINANHDAADRIQAKRFGLNPEDIASLHNAEHGIIKDDSIQLWVNILEGYGEIKTGQFKSSDIYTNEFSPYSKN